MSNTDGASATTRGRHIVRLALFAAFLLGLFYLAGMARVIDVEDVRHAVAATGPAAPLIYVVASAVLGAVFVPGPILAAGSGVLFGPILGTFVTLGAAIGTAIITSVIGRRAGRQSARALLGTDRADRLDAQIERGGLWAVVGQRFVPGISDALASYAFGAFGVPLWQMAVGAFIGSAPRAFVYTALGASIGDLSAPWHTPRSRCGASPPSSAPSPRGVDTESGGGHHLVSSSRRRSGCPTRQPMSRPRNGTAARMALSVALPPVTRVKLDSTNHRLASSPRHASAGAIPVCQTRPPACSRCAQEVDQHGHRRGQHQKHHADSGHARHRPENADQRVDSEHREDQHDHRRGHGLHHRGERGRVVVGCTVPSRRGSNPFPARTNWYRAITLWKDSTQANRLVDSSTFTMSRPTVPACRRWCRAACCLAVQRALRHLGDLVGTDRDHERPTGQRVEAADDEHRRVRRPGNGALGIACLVAEHRGRLEPDEPGEGEQDGDAEGAVGEHVRLEGVEGETRRPGAGDDHQVEDQHDADLERERNAEHLRAQLDVPVTEQRDDCQYCE